MPVPAIDAPHVCPRCGYRGPSVGYFSQGGHMAALIFLSLLTIFPTFGVGGIIYYLMRHSHRVCPRCGESWGPRGVNALALPPGEMPMAPVGPVTDGLPSGDGWSVKNVFAWMLFAVAALCIMIGFGEGAPEAVITGLGFGAAGFGVRHWAKGDREERRRALLQALQTPVLRLAAERGGRLTVTEVASSFGWPLPRAEKVLNSLEDGLRVSSDVTNEGVIVYEFRELMHRKRLTAAEMDSLLAPPPPAEREAIPPPRHDPASGM
ncbi:MAG TPA: hypothetical protein VFQ45_12525 [Longimicrobium sp.]|nr:hypothetical protein [Longimicrobium sp.]